MVFGFRHMRPFTRLVSVLAIYTPIVNIFLDDDADAQYFPAISAIQWASLIMLLYLNKTRQYWR